MKILMKLKTSLIALGMTIIHCIAMETIERPSPLIPPKSTCGKWTYNWQGEEWPSSSRLPRWEHTPFLANPQFPLFLEAYSGGIRFHLPQHDSSGKILQFMKKPNVRQSFFPLLNITDEMLAISLAKHLKNNNILRNPRDPALRLNDTLWQVFDAKEQMIGLILLERLTADNSFYADFRYSFAFQNVIVGISPIVQAEDCGKDFIREILTAVTSSLFKMANARAVYTIAHPSNEPLHKNLKHAGFEPIRNPNYDNYRKELQNDLGFELEESAEFLVNKESYGVTKQN